MSSYGIRDLETERVLQDIGEVFVAADSDGVYRRCDPDDPGAVRVLAEPSEERTRAFRSFDGPRAVLTLVHDGRGVEAEYNPFPRKDMDDNLRTATILAVMEHAKWGLSEHVGGGGICAMGIDGLWLFYGKLPCPPSNAVVPDPEMESMFGAGAR